jgi:hypothetical protein
MIWKGASLASLKSLRKLSGKSGSLGQGVGVGIMGSISVLKSSQ